ncbi:hypothetical protein PROFUN_01335 [Planoprotostelium fungivorum]|uniref:Uncharacterized protein n=1 Tax=Planoprotostelium fungivorum TaxID=1890364 RepID=A0A2P6NZU8_9EUKA|nr:hypothetical protein PROFUN_01335 [Planoprotostelium fungivorum]
MAFETQPTRSRRSVQIDRWCPRLFAIAIFFSLLGVILLAILLPLRLRHRQQEVETPESGVEVPINGNQTFTWIGKLDNTTAVFFYYPWEPRSDLNAASLKVCTANLTIPSEPVFIWSNADSAPSTDIHNPTYTLDHHTQCLELTNFCAGNLFLGMMSKANIEKIGFTFSATYSEYDDCKIDTAPFIRLGLVIGIGGVVLCSLLWFVLAKLALNFMEERKNREYEALLQ